MLWRITINYHGTPRVREDIVNEHGDPASDDDEILAYHLDDREAAERRQRRLENAFGEIICVGVDRPSWCGNCKFFDPPVCRRFPPPHQEVKDVDWCGEFSLR